MASKSAINSPYLGRLNALETVLDLSPLRPHYERLRPKKMPPNAFFDQYNRVSIFVPKPGDIQQISMPKIANTVSGEKLSAR